MIMKVKNKMYKKAKSVALLRIPSVTIALIFFIFGILVTVWFYESNKEEGMIKILISIIALVLSFIAFLITRMDKASRDKYEISQIYFNEAKEVLEKSISNICEDLIILLGTGKCNHTL
jgi:cytochrome bd-type quinol oxidase subunit 2